MFCCDSVVVMTMMIILIKMMMMMTVVSAVQPSVNSNNIIIREPIRFEEFTTKYFSVMI